MANLERLHMAKALIESTPPEKFDLTAWHFNVAGNIGELYVEPPINAIGLHLNTAISFKLGELTDYAALHTLFWIISSDEALDLFVSSCDRDSVALEGGRRKWHSITVRRRRQCETRNGWNCPYTTGLNRPGNRGGWLV